MKNPLLANRLDELLETVLIAAPPGSSILSLANEAIGRDRELIADLMQEWQLDHVCQLLRRKQRQMAREQRTAQIMLPGFERLPVHITVEKGRRRPLETATYWQLREYLIVLRRRQQNNSKIAQVKTLMGLIEKWKKKLKGKTKGLTVAEVMQREAGLR